MFLAIDNRPLIRQPHQIEITLPDAQVSMTADQRPLVIPPTPYATINCTWGRDASHEDVLAELTRLRANSGIHSITFEPWRGGRYMTINAYMGLLKHTALTKTRFGSIVTSAFTLPFIQVDTPTFLYPFRIKLQGIIAVLSPFARRSTPAAGTILAIDGHIADLGSGTGQTRFQVRNIDQATDYLSTQGDFVCVPPDRHLQNAVLGVNLNFAQGDEIGINVTQIPTGGLSKNALITLWTWIHKP